MKDRKLYKKRPKYHVTAVQLDLNFDCFTYQKWNNEQTCKSGDWLVNNDGDVYTVDKEYFREYYKKITPGVFEKVGEIWAEIATEHGSINTKEGSTAYKAGDYLVFDREQGGEGYAIKKHIFEKMYEPINEAFDLTPQQQSYLNDRILLKVKNYEKKAKNNQKRFYIWQTLAIVAAALVPVFNVGIDSNSIIGGLHVALLGAVSAVAASLLNLFSFQKNWIKYQNAYQDLESHVEQFKIGASVYWDKKNAFNLLVENCESIISAARGQWTEKSGNKDTQDKE